MSKIQNIKTIKYQELINYFSRDVFKIITKDVKTVRVKTAKTFIIEYDFDQIIINYYKYLETKNKKQKDRFLNKFLNKFFN